MRQILVINPKGGSGKSTLSTNMAAFFAGWGIRVCIADFDPQGSSLQWLAERPSSLPEIEGIAIENNLIPALPTIDYLIMDMPSGQDHEQLLHWINRADRVVIPVMPSPHDIRAAERFLNALLTDDQFNLNSDSVGIIANRVKENARSFNLLKSFIVSVPVPCMGIIRDTQNYVLAAEHGLSIFELPKYKVKKELLQWQRFIKWLSVDQTIQPNIPIEPDEEVTKIIYGS